MVVGKGWRMVEIVRGNEWCLFVLLGLHNETRFKRAFYVSFIDHVFRV